MQKKREGTKDKTFHQIGIFLGAAVYSQTSQNFTELSYFSEQINGDEMGEEALQRSPVQTQQ